MAPDGGSQPSHIKRVDSRAATLSSTGIPCEGDWDYGDDVFEPDLTWAHF